MGVTTDLGCTDADLEVSATRTLTNDHPTCSAHVFVGVTTDLGYIDADLEVGAT